MTTRSSGVPRFRVTAQGSAPAVRDADDPLWEQGEMANAHLWAETVAPNSGFSVERFGTQHRQDDVATSVTLRVTLQAADAPAAESLTRLLLEQALPAVTFSQILAVQITGAYVASVNSEPVCSFCGKTQRQVGKLIAGTGVYICDGCVRIAAEALQHDLPPEGIHD